MADETKTEIKLAVDNTIPIEWINRIFERLKTKYGEDAMPKPDHIDTIKTQWQNGLKGVTAEQIKTALDACPDNKMPSLIQFYHYCKRIPYFRPRTRW